jgi:hypothetical protein
VREKSGEKKTAGYVAAPFVVSFCVLYYPDGDADRRNVACLDCRAKDCCCGAFDDDDGVAKIPHGHDGDDNVDQAEAGGLSHHHDDTRVKVTVDSS